MSAEFIPDLEKELQECKHCPPRDRRLVPRSSRPGQRRFEGSPERPSKGPQKGSSPRPGPGGEAKVRCPLARASRRGPGRALVRPRQKRYYRAPPPAQPSKEQWKLHLGPPPKVERRRPLGTNQNIYFLLSWGVQNPLKTPSPGPRNDVPEPSRTIPGSAKIRQTSQK